MHCPNTSTKNQVPEEKNQKKIVKSSKKTEFRFFRISYFLCVGFFFHFHDL